jgi:hypothetical protein
MTPVLDDLFGVGPAAGADERRKTGGTMESGKYASGSWTSRAPADGSGTDAVWGVSAPDRLTSRRGRGRGNLAGNAAEQTAEVGPEQSDSGDDGDGDQTSDKTVFDSGRPIGIADEGTKRDHDGSFPKGDIQRFTHSLKLRTGQLTFFNNYDAICSLERRIP